MICFLFSILRLDRETVTTNISSTTAYYIYKCLFSNIRTADGGAVHLRGLERSFIYSNEFFKCSSDGDTSAMSVGFGGSAIENRVVSCTSRRFAVITAGVQMSCMTLHDCHVSTFCLLLSQIHVPVDNINITSCSSSGYVPSLYLDYVNSTIKYYNCYNNTGETVILLRA